MISPSVEIERPPLPVTVSHPLRLLMVAARSFPYMGGVETHVYEVGRRFVEAGVDVTVLSTDPSGRLPQHEVIDGVKIRRVRSHPADRDYFFAPGIYRAMQLGRWDIVHCQGYHTLVAPLAMVAAQRIRTPYLVSFHSGGHSSRFRNMGRGVQHTMLHGLLARAARLIAVSPFEAEHFRRELRLPRERFAVIPNGAHLPPAINAESTGDGPLIVSVGRLERYKGHHRIIAAMPHILAHNPRARLRIAGSGPFEAALWQLAHNLGVADRVEIAPVPSQDRAGMATLLREAALLVALSEYESQGIAVMEALAVGCPVLVAHATALVELVERGLARSIPLDSNPSAVGTAVLAQLRDPLTPPPFVLPTWDECAAGLLAVYAGVVAQQPVLSSPGAR